MPATMTKEEVHTFLDSRPGWIIFTSIGADGYPHAIPLGYFRLGDNVIVGGRPGTQKALNVERNPQVSLTLESGRQWQELKGVLIQGSAVVHTNAEELLYFARAGAKRRGLKDEDLPKSAPKEAMYIEVSPDKIISWDYSREE